MIVFSKDVNGLGHKDSETLEDKKTFTTYKTEMKRLEEKYTNYGCYCYISGADNGVHGGGKARDQVDQHCKDLYNCYKCLGKDFEVTHNQMAFMEYNVDLSIGPNGAKDITCTDRLQERAGCPRNLCECDKKFAQAIAKLDDDCQNDPTSASCQSKELRTTAANPPGPFNSPNDPSVCKINHLHDGSGEKACCGTFPERFLYDPEKQDCCEVSTDNILEEIIVPADTCDEKYAGRLVELGHTVHDHPHDTVQGNNSRVLGRSPAGLYRYRLQNRRR